MFKHNRLKQLIIKSGLSYNELDRRMGTVNTVSKYANGHRQATVPTITAFLRHMDMSQEEIDNQKFGDWYDLATPTAPLKEG